MDRRLLAVAALALLVASAGCSALMPGGGEVDRAKLAQNATYDWDTRADVTLNVTSDHYYAVYRVENRSTLAFSGFERLNERRPLEIEAIAFQYPNGTVVGADAMAAEANDTHVAVTLPAERGRFAYRVPTRGKELHLATAAQGSYEVILPPNTRVRYPLLGRVDPGGYETSMQDGRVHVTWDEVTDDRVTVRYYLVRDFWIFAGLVLVGALAAVVGLTYFWLQLRTVRERARSVDVERERP